MSCEQADASGHDAVSGPSSLIELQRRDGGTPTLFLWLWISTNSKTNTLIVVVLMTARLLYYETKGRGHYFWFILFLQFFDEQEIWALQSVRPQTSAYFHEN